VSIKLRVFVTFIALAGLCSFGIAAFADQHDSLHMKDLDCTKCHTCDNPTPEDMCLKPCPTLSMAHETSKHRLAEAPEKMMLGSIADLYKPVSFNHKLHAEMAGMGSECATCHHYSPPGEKIPPCKECHGAGNPTNLRQPGLKGAYHRQCLACHREWSHETKCVVCHLPEEGKIMEQAHLDSTDIMGIAHPVIEAPEVKLYNTPYTKGQLVTFYHEEHIQLFGLACANCHQKENCGYCHDLQLASSKPKKSMEEVHAICNDCHIDDACSKCHGTKQKDGFKHAQTGWPLNRFHQKLGCRSCHPTGREISKLNNECSNCHGGWNQDNFEHLVTGLQLSETHLEFECENCHLDGQYDQPPDCSTCHDEIDYTDTPPGEYVDH